MSLARAFSLQRSKYISARSLSGFAPLLIAALLAGCFEHGEEFRQLAPPERPPGAVSVPVREPALVFPLQVGSRYDYSARFGLGTGLFGGAAILSVLDAWRLGEREEDVVSARSSYFGRTRLDRYVFVRRGGWIGLREKAPPDKITFFMPTALVPGQTWQVETGEGTGTACVEALEDVAVGAGCFLGTYRVRYRNEPAGTELTLWLAPGIGLVRAQVRLRIAVLPLSGELELERYELPLP